MNSEWFLQRNGCERRGNMYAPTAKRMMSERMKVQIERHEKTLDDFWTPYEVERSRA